MSDFQQLTILGTRVASVTYDEAVALLLARAERKPAHAYACAVNVHTVSVARRDSTFRDVLNGAYMSVPDGKPLVWAHRLLGGRTLPDRVYGPTLMLKLCEAAAKKGFSIYLYGGKTGVPEKLADALKRKIQGLDIVGAYSPPFGDRADDDPALLKEIQNINASGAALVFVALGAPKQERFMHRFAQRIQPLQIGVGAAFDFHSGSLAQAPGWMQGAGLEWLFRFCAEPRRLWRRYLFYNPYFVVRLFLQKLGLDSASRETNAQVLAERIDAAKR
jgi:N-acetylglucosaminyldiphosphoundecaprenol N-acetyl-beta-D-mannosaminyltransferase